VTTIALEQLRPEVGNASANLDRIVSLARGAFAQSTGVAVFPELGPSGSRTDETVPPSVATPVPGPAIAQGAEVTREHDGVVVLGFAEPEGAEIFNSVVIVRGSGPILHYRKLHLFAAERVFSLAYLGVPTLDTHFGRLAARVCYDLRFVEVLRLLSPRGADLVFASAAWVGGFDSVVPSTGLPGRPKRSCAGEPRPGRRVTGRTVAGGGGAAGRVARRRRVRRGRRGAALPAPMSARQCAPSTSMADGEDRGRRGLPVPDHGGPRRRLRGGGGPR
jgi:hypothetical protein